MILFVPGIKGSELFEGNNKRWFPATKQDVELLGINNDLDANDVLKQVTPFGLGMFTEQIYQGILDEFGEEVVLFPYDWRKSLFDHVDRLIEQIELLSRSESLTIVAHSMGGLLSKLAILKINESENEVNINKFITVGTPWKGSPDSFKALVYGEPGVFENLANFYQFLDTKSTRSLARQYPAVYQLLPSEEYFNLLDGKFILPDSNTDLTYEDVQRKVQIIYNKENEKKDSERVLDVWSKYITPLHDEMKKAIPEKIEHINIVGYSIPTLYKIPENSKAGIGLTKKYKNASVFMNGDGVVPLDSAKPYHNAKIFYAVGEHKNLCSDETIVQFIRKCIEEASLEGITGVISETTTGNPIINNDLKAGYMARVMCPVETTILDNEGRYIAGVFDPSITEISDIAKEKSFKYFSIADAKYLYFDKKYEKDLTFEISAYEEGIASVSLEDYEDNKELNFSTIPVNRGKSAKLIIPADEEISGSILKVDEQELLPKVKDNTDQDIIDEIPVPKVKIKIEQPENVEKVPFRHTYSGPIILNIEGDVQDNIEELFYSIDGNTIHRYNEKSRLDLNQGEHIIEVFGKDKFNRDIIGKELKVWIETQYPKTKMNLLIDPDGIFINFLAFTNNSPYETFYRIIKENDDTDKVEFGKVENERVKVPAESIRVNPKASVKIEFFSKHIHLPFIENTNIFELHLGNIPLLMWTENTSALNAEMIFNNITQNELLTIKDFSIKQLIQNKYYPIEADAIIGDNVKSIKFESKMLDIEVLFSEKYSLYFSGPPTELLKLGQKYEFSFELRTERTNENITTTDPVAKLHPIKAKHVPDKRIRLTEKNGTFYGHFTVDKNFKLFKHKLIITDSKNVSPALREITLLLDMDND
ncbi:lipase/acyltransferase domain-containing protein [Fictibacillus arsenicus]|uniref:Alpha/beta hydrolase n=1 Tax=Fictibacillus arsenicus TaxID=255247 RepID=A0A1V3GB26_9BACL|nr:hypothetical protein [Fictibacillus arsenicus]OOE14063.1 hypothetical protein UN64_02295 [Fictibacillus arsenicus]